MAVNEELVGFVGADLAREQIAATAFFYYLADLRRDELEIRA